MKNKAKEILTKIVIENNNSFDIEDEKKITKDVIKAMFEFARLACEEQKNECYEARFDSILNCKNVCDL